MVLVLENHKNRRACMLLELFGGVLGCCWPVGTLSCPFVNDNWPNKVLCSHSWPEARRVWYVLAMSSNRSRVFLRVHLQKKWQRVSSTGLREAHSLPLPPVLSHCSFLWRDQDKKSTRVRTRSSNFNYCSISCFLSGGCVCFLHNWKFTSFTWSAFFSYSTQLLLALHRYTTNECA